MGGGAWGGLAAVHWGLPLSILPGVFLRLSRFSYCLASKPSCIACRGSSVSWAFPPSYWFLLPPSSAPPRALLPILTLVPTILTWPPAALWRSLRVLFPQSKWKKEKLHEGEFVLFVFLPFWAFYSNLNSSGWDSHTTWYEKPLRYIL